MSKVKLQDVAIWIFMIFSMVYFFIPIESECDMSKELTLWSCIFFIFTYGLIVSLLLHFVIECYGVRKIYYVFALSYFSVLVLLNVICLVDTDLYVPLISNTGPITIPFIVIISVTGIINIYLLIKRSQKP